MCNSKSIFLRVSNKGQSVLDLVTNQKFSVNLPSALRQNKECYITVIDGNITLTTQNGVNIMKDEVGILSNIPMYGFNTETSLNSNNFMSENNKILFNVDLSSLSSKDGSAGKVSCQMLNQRTFYCAGGLPQRLEFERYMVSGGIISPFIIDNYLSFTLKIDFIENE